MIKSISVWAFDAKRPLPEVFTMARENGFEAVEVAVAEDGPITPQSTQQECERVVGQAQQAGVQLAGLASGLGWAHPLTSPDQSVSRRGIGYAAKSLQVAHWLGVDTMLLVPGLVGAEFIAGSNITPYEVAYENALAALQELKPIAEGTGVNIGVENVWNKFLISPLETRDFLDKVGSERVGSYFDVGNVILTGYPEQWIAILGHRIKRIHFKDYKREVGNLSGFCDLLAGDVDFGAVMNALRGIGYNGFVTSEFFNCEGDLPKISSAMDMILAM
jgi:hexulose-6-phosphate isomerase